jgi:serine O-acetyltransferase
MRFLFQAIRQYVLPVLFNMDGIVRLEKDLSRRFSKPELASYSTWQRIKYIRQHIQYLALFYYRLSHACKVDMLKRIFSSQYQKYSLRSGIEISNPNLGGGVIMPHWGRIVLNAKHIGENLYVFHSVTVGNDYTSGKPEIGDNVFIGTNSVILGDIKIGNNVLVGACSFVNSDIPSNSLVAGNPAKIIRSIEDDFIAKMIGY